MTSKQSSKSFINVTLVLLVLALLLAGGYTLFGENKTPATSTSDDQTTVTLTQKDYSFPEHKFALIYPAEWQTFEDYGTGNHLTYSYLGPVTAIEAKDPKKVVVINVYKDTSVKAPKELVGAAETNTKVGGENAKKYTSTNAMAYVVVKGDKKYELIAYNDLRNNLDSIVKTFKFTK
jgi:hypothetical protein